MNTRTTTRTPLRKARSAGQVHGIKTIGDPADGIFEAYVSVFGNVDYGGDRIKAGAFADSLARWAAAGDPIPVIFSHDWNNLDANIGEVIEAEEHHPGDPRLAGTGLEENGGLFVKFSLEMDEDFAARVAKKLTKRTIREFSFAYDVLREDRGTDGVTDLLELDLIEVGPTLKGMNPATVLLSKTLGDGWEDLSETDLLDRLAEAVKSRDTGEKARVSVDFEGSIETELEAIYSAGVEWAKDLDVGNGGFFALHQEATFPTELRAIVLVEGWSDPWDEGIFYELTFERDADGALSVAEAHEIEVSVEVARKARALKFRGRSTREKAVGGTVSGEKNTGQTKDNGEDRETGNPEDPEETGQQIEETGTDPLLAELEMLSDFG